MSVNGAETSDHTHETITRAKANLVTAGYNLGDAKNGEDGKAEDLTTKAIKRFQESVGLEPTGKLDQETILALDQVTKLGMTKQKIEKIGKGFKQLLHKDHFDVSPPVLRLGGDTKYERELTKQINRINRMIEFGIKDKNGKYIIKPAAQRYVDAAIKQGVLPQNCDRASEIKKAVKALKWDQRKINRVWEKANELGIDPRVMIAVISQEGTGSFDTNSKVIMGGGNGIELDFEKDLNNAMKSHILSKLWAYSHYGNQFQQAVIKEGLSGGGNVFQYTNYNVPRISWNNKTKEYYIGDGCYAQHSEWWKGVSNFYEKISGDGYTHAYSQFLVNNPIKLPSGLQLPKVEFYKVNTGTDSSGKGRYPVITYRFVK